MRTIIEFVERRPGAAFGGFLAVHFAAWTALPTLLYANLPLDLIEALTYGREWQLGHDKLPPLPWWMVEIAYTWFGHDVAYYALAQLAVVAAFAAVWAVALPLIGPVGALVSVMLLDGMHYFNFTAVKFNHDVIQLPLWALAGLGLWRALRGTEARSRLIGWLLLGFALGAGLWAKYFIVVLAAPIAVFLLGDREARQALRTPGPYLAAAIALIVAAPHLVWLVQNDFLPFHYADVRAAPSRGWLDHLLHPLQFLGSQLGFVLPTLVIAAPLFFPRGQSTPSAAVPGFDRRIVAMLALGPAATVVALSLVTGRGTISTWGYPLWLFLGLWLLLIADAAVFDRLRLGRVLALWLIVFSCLAAAFVADYTVAPLIDHRYRAAFFPGDRLGPEIASRFRAITGTPLRYIIGTMWVGGNISHYSAERPRVLIDGDPRRAPWINLADLKARGAVVAWTEDPNVLPERYRAVASDAEIQPPLVLPAHRVGTPVTIGWAVLRPNSPPPPRGPEGR